MLKTRELFESMAARSGPSAEKVSAAVEAMQDCAEAVTACSTAMLAEGGAGSMSTAISRDMDCADVVTATRNVLTRGNGPDTGLLSAQLEACLLACERSYESCQPHAAHHTHCRLCSEATRHCADTCRQVINSLHG